jgi:putative flippase GtrA
MIQTRTEQTGVRLRSPRWPYVLAAARSGELSLAGRLLSDGARPLRFALTGGLSGLFQLAVLALLTGRGWPEFPANLLAFLPAAQVNFALSSLFTWRDRRTAAPLWRRWLMFHASIAAMAVANQLVFLAAHTVLPTLPAAASGIAAAAVGNFLLGDRLVFRANRDGRATPLRQDDATSGAA